jgi:drug/metabolite transporter (DMT)-like permease
VTPSVRPSSTPRATGTTGALLGLGAAVSFGLSAPLAKLLLGEVSPVLLAGLLYLGAAAGLWLAHLIRPQTEEARLQRSDLPRLASIVLTGGVLGPVAMLFGLMRVSALTGSLCLNLEAPFTVLLAVLVFGEHLGRQAALGVACILGGAVLLGLGSDGVASLGDAPGALLIAAACLCWALDNNLTQQLSVRDPFAIVRVKTLVAGATNTLLGLWFARGALPSGGFIAGALLLGSVSYGLSVVLDTYALRLVGAAREAAYFATAPFIGALAALFLFGDALRGLDAGAMAVMALGVLVLLAERHRHLHTHEALEHEHLHYHDEHHEHTHAPGTSLAEPHNHRHRHGGLVHDHPHLPDAHHRHEH